MEMFPALENVVGRAGPQLDAVQHVVIVHLKLSCEQFGKYLKRRPLANHWVRNPISKVQKNKEAKLAISLLPRAYMETIYT